MKFIALVLLAAVPQIATAFVPLRRGAANTFGAVSFSQPRAPQWRVASPPVSALSTTASAVTPPAPPMSNFAKKLTKIGMIGFITTVALGLISSLSVIKLLGYLGVSEVRRQRLALSTGQFCARWALRLFPFCKLEVIVDKNAEHIKNPEPAIWVCNHMSMLDVFLLLAADKKMRGRKKRPIKVVYWKQLEDNPFTKILFRQSGFIPIDMTPNEPGEANQYDPKSMKAFLKSSKQAFVEGFDIGILPEGQLNPAPEKGLLPLFSGAYVLARMSKRPIQMMALHGVNRLWHPNDGMEVGDMNVTGRNVKIRIYPNARKYASNDDFKETFSAVVGHFGKTGEDVEHLDEWLSGSKWTEIDQQRKQKAKEEEEAKQAAEAEQKLKQEQEETKVED